MNSAAKIDNMVAEWKARGLSAEEIIINTAEAEIGWCYVWGATGQQCTPANRRTYANRASCPAAEAQETLRKCQVTRESNPKSNCNGCEWYPDGARTLMDDCQGWIKQTGSRAGIHFTGGGCSSMWRTASNWDAQGTIDTLPERLCCVFWQNKSNPNVMDHIGWYIGNGMMIHCSGKVKREKLSARCTHWAIPKGLGGELPVTKPTLRKGSSGEYVTLLQTKLIQLGYDLAPYGADGKFGAKTESAVKAFQRDKGLEPDGVVGPKTWDALDDGTVTAFTVTIQHLSRSVAEKIVGTYGGTMQMEGD